jgi:DNA-binding beta-propeller fold protein YncE
MKKIYLSILTAICLCVLSCQKDAKPILKNEAEVTNSVSASAVAEFAPYTVRTVAGIFEQTSTAPHLVNGPSLQAKFWKPHGITVNGDGNLYVADFFNNAIRKITIDNKVYTAPLSYNTHTGGALNPEAVGVAADGTLYIVSTAYGIRIYNKDKGIDIYSRIGNADSNLDIEKESNGTMWFVNDNSLGKIKGVTIQRNVVNFSDSLDQYETLRGIGIGPNGVKYVSTASKLFKVTQDGKIKRLFPSTKFIFISGITVTKDGSTLYIADNQSIKKIHQNTITTITRPLSQADGRDGVGLEADVVAANLALANSEKFLYVTDIRNTIRKISL